MIIHHYQKRAADAQAYIDRLIAPALRRQKWAQEWQDSILSRYAYLSTPQGDLRSRPRIRQPLKAS